MNKRFLDSLQESLNRLKQEGLYKQERPLCSPQQGRITVQMPQEAPCSLLNLCANNYLGLANHPALIKAAQESLGREGFGLASVRFICGTHLLHRTLEESLSLFLQTEETILYSSCFDANGGLFETLLSEEDAIISDALNHASIIDGIRLCKAGRFRYKNNDMADLEAKLKEAQSARFKMIATDGVFSMDGIIANLPDIVALAKQYDAIVMVDDSHAVGFLGEEGRGTPEYWGLSGEIDILTGTLGKALGGASGGYVSGKKEVIHWLRQRSRPYLFSNTLSPTIAATSLEVLQLLKREGTHLRTQLWKNTAYFRRKMETLGFKLLGKDHPIIPILLEDAELTQRFAERLFQEGIYAVGFFYPVVPKGSARIRTQMSAAHTESDLEQAIALFEKVGKELNII